MALFVPPIKCQGIKTKLVPWVNEVLGSTQYSKWIEPFMGSGVVGFNIQPKRAQFSDSNPHLIRFYTALQTKEITASIVKDFLESEGEILRSTNGEHYYAVRERFNTSGNPLDFLFLNRACFNGVMRFNSKRKFNVPFCKKPERFAQAYITKICNQVMYTQEIIRNNDYTFTVMDFRQALEKATPNDFVYCDPPYIGRHVDYFDSWEEKDEFALHELLKNANSNFILSTWHSNEYRNNDYIQSLWHSYNLLTRAHFYYVGASEDNRKPMLEALLTNLDTSSIKEQVAPEQMLLAIEPAMA